MSEFICTASPRSLGYKELLRVVQGYGSTSINKAAFDQCIRVFERCNIIDSRWKRKGEGTIQSTSLSRMAGQRYSNLIRLPDIDTRSRKRRRERVLIFLNALMPPCIPNCFLPWNSLRGHFPYLTYAYGGQVNCKHIKHSLGMSLVELVSRRPLESEYIFFKNHLTYTKDEIKRFCEGLESINNNGINFAIHRPIEVNGKIYEGIEDKLLCDYTARMQFLLLAFKYLEEFDLISTLHNYETLREAFSNRYIKEHGMKYFGPITEKIEDRELFSAYNKDTNSSTKQSTARNIRLRAGNTHFILMRCRT